MPKRREDIIPPEELLEAMRAVGEFLNGGFIWQGLNDHLKSKPGFYSENGQPNDYQRLFDYQDPKSYLRRAQDGITKIRDNFPRLDNLEHEPKLFKEFLAVFIPIRSSKILDLISLYTLNLMEIATLKCELQSNWLKRRLNKNALANLEVLNYQIEQQSEILSTMLGLSETAERVLESQKRG